MIRAMKKIFLKTKLMPVTLAILLCLGTAACGSATSIGANGHGREKENANAKAKSQKREQEETMVFRDVFGKEYKTVIDPGIPACRYDKSRFSRNGDRMSYDGEETMLGVDVSHHQGKINWQKVKSAGYDFAVLRIAYRGYGKTGSLNADRMFEQYYRDAKAAGLKIGVYFFAQAINEAEAKEEAEYVLSILDGRKLELPVVYDPESILDDEARTDDVSGAQFTANTRVFCATIKAGGYDPMIYANMLWEAFELDLTKLVGIPVWYADYEKLPQTPYDFDMWQYTNEGNVPGIKGKCDLDIWF